LFILLDLIALVALGGLVFVLLFIFFLRVGIIDEDGTALLHAQTVYLLKKKELKFVSIIIYLFIL
jgi:hypothetical protein